MKKMQLFSLIFMLNFYSYNNSKEFIFQDNILKNGLNYAIGLFGIKVCNSTNPLEIKAHAIVNSCYSGYLSYKDFRNTVINYKEAQGATNPLMYTANSAFAALNLYAFFDHAQFCYHGLKLFQKSKKIAKFNKSMQLNLTNEKIRQVIWLTLNATLPFLCFAASKMYYDKVNFKEAFYKETRQSNSFDIFIPSEQALRIGYLLTTLSENKRLKTLNKKVKKETQRRLKQSY